MNNNLNQFLSFPKNFLWGVSTSPHQIEGDNHNDWSQWEKSEPRLDQLKKQNKVTSDYLSDKAANSWELFELDFDLVQELNCTTYRMGVEWSRLEPSEGIYDQATFEHYKKMFASLKARKIKLVLTLWHWTNPLWISENGGWANKSTINHFTRYADKCFREFDEFVDYWVILNEPTVHILNGYLKGNFPPNQKSIINAYKTAQNLISSQRLVYKQIHKAKPQAQVGFTTLANFIEPARKYNLLDLTLAKVFDYIWNIYFVQKTKNYLDFVALDYYFHDRVTAQKPYVVNENLSQTDMGWEIYPEGIYEVIKNFSRFDKPIYIMENGLADEKDEKREQFIKDHLAYIHKAITDGYDVRGYFHWSLLDNFEWAEGHTAKFGLYRVDRATFARTPQPSAKEYSRICHDNGFWLV